MTTTERDTLIAEIEAAGLESPEQVADMVLDAASQGGIEAGRAKLADCVACDNYEFWRLELERLNGLSARQWGEESDEGDPGGPRAAMLEEIASAIRECREPVLPAVRP